MCMAISMDLCYFIIFGESYSIGMLFNRDPYRFLLQWGLFFGSASIFLIIAGYSNLTIPEKLVLLFIGIIFSASTAVAKDTLNAEYIFYTLVPLGYYNALKIVKAYRINSDSIGKSWANFFLWLMLAMISMGIATNSALRVGSILFPLTYDAHLLKIDAAFPDFAKIVAQAGNDSPQWFKTLTTFVYSLLSFLFFPLIALLIRHKKLLQMHGWRTMVIPFMVAWICYMWIPATGPIAAFGSENFPALVPSSTNIPSSLLSVPPAARNAMPSMHLSGAVLVSMVVAITANVALFSLSLIFLGLTAFATLALGEHYVIDLVVALPFSVALGIWLIYPPKRAQGKIGYFTAHWSATITFIVWMLLIRITPFWLEENLWFVQALSAWSATIATLLYIIFVRSVWKSREEDRIPEKSPIEIPKNIGATSSFRWIFAVFFASGFAGLLYEVSFSKALATTFGGTALAAYTVLTTYMGGMAIGAWLGGIIAEKTTRPLWLYAILEAIIGIYAASTPIIFKAIQAIYVGIALDQPPDAGFLTFLRTSLGALSLGIPTVLMGATLPLVFKHLKNCNISTSQAIAPLYGSNVLGAAIGSIFAGYFIIPALGRTGSTLVAAAISLLVSLYVIEKIKTIKLPSPKNVLNFHSALKNTQEPIDSTPSKQLGISALIILGVGGFITLSLEVVYMHILAVVAGNSVYAFGLMLATFLSGLGIGSIAGEKALRHFSRTFITSISQCAIAISIISTLFLWNGLTAYFGSFGYSAVHGVYLDFSSRELVRAAVCAIAMFPPAFFIGASYPSAIGIATDWLARRRSAARCLGIASGINTAGNILGVLLTGFLLLPLLGSYTLLLVLAGISFLLATILSAYSANSGIVNISEKKSKNFSRRAIYTLVVGGLFTILIVPKNWDLQNLSQGTNVYFRSQYWGEIVDHAESVEGGLTTVALDAKGLKTLLTNGKFQGNNSTGGEMIAQESFALMPLLHLIDRNNALVIGYGTGTTARTLNENGFHHQDIVELSKDIVVMADRYFSEINHEISSKPNIKIHYTDGRNYLLTQSKKYDLISMEITSIWFAGAASLYNKEFYQLAKKRLTKDGVLQQWVQMHHMRPIDFLYILGSIRSEFKYVWLYFSGGQGIIVASNSDSSLKEDNARKILLSNKILTKERLESIDNDLIASPKNINDLLERYDPSMQFFISTDDNLYLEYATPKGNATTEDTVKTLITMVRGIH